MVLRILGIALAVWIVFSILGAVLHFLVAAIVIGAVIFIGAAGYSAIRGRGTRRELP
jgi:hypothetical protein